MIEKHLAFDLETWGADQLFRQPTMMRLGAWGTVADGATLTTDGDAITRALVGAADSGAILTGHNLCDFDLLVQARWHGLDLTKLHGKIMDTYLLALVNDPPPSGKDGVALRPRGYYSLDNTCRLYGLDGKVDEAARLAKKHGGYEKIPTDDPEYRAYLTGDIHASSRLFDRMPVTAYGWREQNVGLITSAMRLNGFRVDVAENDRALEEQAIRKRLNLVELAEMTGLKIDGYLSPLASDQGKEAIKRAFLAAGLKERALPVTPKTGKISLGSEPLGELKEKIRKHGGHAKLERMIDLITSVVSERTIYKTIEDTRVDDRCHASIKPSQASGRWSVTGPGLTVFGKRDGRHVERRVLLPEVGHSLMCVDLDQIDARMVAAHSQDRAYMKIFQDGLDLHGVVAMQIFGDLKFREAVKPISHGWNYGRKAKAIAEGSDGRIPMDVALTFDREMRRNHPGIVEWQRNVRQVAMDGGLLDNGFGRKMRADPQFAYTQAPALVGQGATRDVMAEGLLRLPVEVWPYLRTLVHDEIVLSVPTEQFEDIAKIVQDAFTFEFMGVPITCGVSKPAHNWAAAYAK